MEFFLHPVNIETVTKFKIFHETQIVTHPRLIVILKIYR